MAACDDELRLATGIYKRAAYAYAEAKKAETSARAALDAAIVRLDRAKAAMTPREETGVHAEVFPETKPWGEQYYDDLDD